MRDVRSGDELKHVTSFAHRCTGRGVIPGLDRQNELEQCSALTVRRRSKLTTVRQNELEQCSALPVRRRSKLTSVMLNNHATNGQSQSHSVRLGRNERRKDAVQSVIINARPGVFYQHRNSLAIAKLSSHM